MRLHFFQKEEESQYSGVMSNEKEISSSLLNHSVQTSFEFQFKTIHPWVGRSVFPNWLCLSLFSKTPWKSTNSILPFKRSLVFCYQNRTPCHHLSNSVKVYVFAYFLGYGTLWFDTSDSVHCKDVSRMFTNGRQSQSQVQVCQAPRVFAGRSLRLSVPFPYYLFH